MLVYRDEITELEETKLRADQEIEKLNKNYIETIKRAKAESAGELADKIQALQQEIVGLESLKKDLTHGLEVIKMIKAQHMLLHLTVYKCFCK